MVVEQELTEWWWKINSCYIIHSYCSSFNIIIITVLYSESLSNMQIYMMSMFQLWSKLKSDFVQHPEAISLNDGHRWRNIVVVVSAGIKMDLRSHESQACKLSYPFSILSMDSQRA